MYARFLKIIQLNSENLRTGREHRVQEEMTENSLTDNVGRRYTSDGELYREPCEEALWLSLVGLG